VTWFYYISTLVVRMIFFLFTRLRVRGRENVPTQGPVLIIANHLNLADPPLIAVSFSRYKAFMAKEELFRSGFSRYVMSRYNAFPVQRGQLDKKALRQAGEVLAEGSALVMFPEGGRSSSAQLQTAFSGSALVAVRSGVPILPVGIAGTDKMKGKTWPFRRPRVTVNIGKAFSLPPVDGRLTKAKLTELTDYMMGHIAELLPPEYQGVYAGREK
jgi:1-acyl-sn-glycerol-3-phosphate acyltransferase